MVADRCANDIIFYHSRLEMNWQATFLISMNQPLKGLLNTLITGVILIVLQLYWPAAKNLGLESLRLANLIFHIQLTIVMRFFSGELLVVFIIHSKALSKLSFLFLNFLDFALPVALSSKIQISNDYLPTLIPTFINISTDSTCSYSIIRLQLSARIPSSIE
ncbi:MAG: hypothetical protein ACI910_000624 [Oleispira sp.]